MTKQISCGYCTGWSQCPTCAERQRAAEVAAATEDARRAAATARKPQPPLGTGYVACAKCTGTVGDDGRCQDCGWQPQSDE